jgi:D-xylose transport system substrate-binding protein
VLDYERLIPDADVAWYVSYDNYTVGKLQAQALVDKMAKAGKPNGAIVMIDGSPTDHNAVLFKQGAHSVLDTSGLKIGAEYDTPDWSPDQAQQEMQQAITRLGKDNINGVYAANDGTAGGAIAALRQAGIDPLPPITGQDAEIAAIQRIIAGQQFMTIYKAIDPEAKQSADVAVALGQGRPIPSGAVNQQVDNGTKKVPSTIYTPVVVTTDNVKSTVFADGFVTYAQVCTQDYRQACQQAGIAG